MKKEERGHLSTLWFLALGALSGEPQTVGPRIAKDRACHPRGAQSSLQALGCGQRQQPSSSCSSGASVRSATPSSSPASEDAAEAQALPWLWPLRPAHLHRFSPGCLHSVLRSSGPGHLVSSLVHT